VDLFDLDEDRARERLLYAVGAQVLPRLAAFPGRAGRPSVPGSFPGQLRPAPADQLAAAIRHLAAPLKVTRMTAIGDMEKLIAEHPTAIDLLTDMARALASLVRGNDRLPHPPEVSAALSLLVQLAGVNHDLRNAHMEGVDLAGADLAGVRLDGAELYNAKLDGADLSGARLTGAGMSGAQPAGTRLTGANLARARLYGANLSGAQLDKADLTEAALSGANITDANLDEADLTRAQGLTQAQLNTASGSAATLLPEGLTYPDAWPPF
jgi:hypothetical protein